MGELPLRSLTVSADVTVPDPTPVVLETLTDTWCIAFAETQKKSLDEIECWCESPADLDSLVCRNSKSRRRAADGSIITLGAATSESTPGQWAETEEVTTDAVNNKDISNQVAKKIHYFRP